MIFEIVLERISLVSKNPLKPLISGDLGFDSVGSNPYYCAPMNDQQIPQCLDPFKQIGAGVEMTGNVALSSLNRLEGLLEDSGGKVNITLKFYRDEQKIPLVSGEISSLVVLTCQRCLAKEKVEVKGSFLFALLRSEDNTENLPENYEPLVLEKPEIDLHALIEEELILALPIVYYHPDGCEPPDGKTTFGDLAEGDENKPNPFAVLEKLKS